MKQTDTPPWPPQTLDSHDDRDYLSTADGVTGQVVAEAHQNHEKVVFLFPVHGGPVVLFLNHAFHALPNDTSFGAFDPENVFGQSCSGATPLQNKD